MISVIGTTTLDIFVSGFETLPEIDGDEFTASSLVFCENPVRTGMGGNGGNSAYVLAKLGVPVSLYSALGRDGHGELLRNWLQDAGADLSNLTHSSTSGSSSTIVLTDENRNRLSFHHHGASAEITPEILSDSDLSANDFLLFTGYPLLTGWNSQQLAELFEHTQQHHTVTCLDIGPLVGDPVTLSLLKSVFSHLNYLLCNEFELLEFTKTDSVREGVDICLEAGVETIVVKQGKNGAVFAGLESTELTHVRSYDVTVKSTVGAGDSFNAGFLFGLSRGWNELQSIQFGNAVAAMVLHSGNGVLGAPDSEHVQQFIHSGRIYLR